MQVGKQDWGHWAAGAARGSRYRGAALRTDAFCNGAPGPNSANEPGRANASLRAYSSPLIARAPARKSINVAPCIA
jgi:hypothetical protein